jgi:hypothetical protein
LRLFLQSAVSRLLSGGDVGLPKQPSEWASEWAFILNVTAFVKRNDAAARVGLWEVCRHGLKTLSLAHDLRGDRRLALRRGLLHGLRHLHLFLLLNLFLDQRHGDVGRDDPVLHTLLEFLDRVAARVGQDLLSDTLHD